MPNFINFLSVILINYNQQPGDICTLFTFNCRVWYGTQHWLLYFKHMHQNATYKQNCIAIDFISIPVKISSTCVAYGQFIP